MDPNLNVCPYHSISCTSLTSQSCLQGFRGEAAAHLERVLPSAMLLDLRMGSQASLLAMADAFPSHSSIRHSDLDRFRQVVVLGAMVIPEKGMYSCCVGEHPRLGFRGAVGLLASLLAMADAFPSHSSIRHTDLDRFRQVPA